jgi:hypothetical protein
VLGLGLDGTSIDVDGKPTQRPIGYPAIQNGLQKVNETTQNWWVSGWNCKFTRGIIYIHTYIFIYLMIHVYK